MLECLAVGLVFDATQPSDVKSSGPEIETVTHRSAVNHSTAVQIFSQI